MKLNGVLKGSYPSERETKLFSGADKVETADVGGKPLFLQLELNQLMPDELLCSI